jgi:RNA-directed DNA polymerase
MTEARNDELSFDEEGVKRAARAAYYRELKLAERATGRALVVGAGPAGNHLATALADACLAAPSWEAEAVRTTAAALFARAPRWLGAVVAEVIEAYPRPPFDRPGELTRYIARLASFREHVPGAPGAGQEAEKVALVSYVVSPTRTVHRPHRTPVIDDLGRLAEWLELTPSEVDWFADTKGMNRRAADRRLRHYTYRWLNGRLIEAPKPRLRAMQRRILAEILGPVPIHPAAHGFVPGRSPHTFAAPHAGQPVVVRLDVLSFFASVTAARVYGLFRTIGYPEPVAYALAGLCTTWTPARIRRGAPPHTPDRDYRLALLGAPHLPQGAPTSPALANLCGFRLDRRLTGLARVLGLRYTRYADDLAFSGRLARPGTLVEPVTGIAADEGFRLNPAKTRVRSASDRQALAGLVVNVVPAVPRDEYDALRALLHNAARTGLAEQNRDGHADFAGYLAGRVAWVGHRHPARAAKLARLLAAATADPSPSTRTQ